MSQSRNQRRSRLSPASLRRRPGARRSGSAARWRCMRRGRGHACSPGSTRLEIADESPPVVPVELVTIGDKTNIKAVAPEPDKLSPAEDRAPKVDERADTAIEAAPPPVEMAPPPKAEPAPPPPDQATSEPLIKGASRRRPRPNRPRPPAGEEEGQVRRQQHPGAARQASSRRRAPPMRRPAPHPHQGHRRAERDDHGSRRCAPEPDRAMLEPAGRRAASRTI